ncbi:MAG: thiamine-phosphate kinase [Planctomycetaceae bacterium]
MDVTEEELLGAIHKILWIEAPELVVPVGDDAAVVRPGAGDLVLTTDALVEGVHFVGADITPHDLGHRAIAVNVSDVAAMAASPRYALCALTLADWCDASWTMELFGGMREACEDYACTLVGGNLARGRDVTVAVTLTGEVAPGRAVRRSGARPGQPLVVTGELGSAAAGRRIRAERGRWDQADLEAIRRADRPVARVGEAQALARHGATAMIDLSDGLALDLSRLCAASGVGARVRLADLPTGPRAFPEEALGGGEDYELLATLPTEAAAAAAAVELDQTFGVALTTIGLTTEDGALVAVGPGGEEGPLGRSGWDHFA